MRGRAHGGCPHVESLDIRQRKMLSEKTRSGLREYGKVLLEEVMRRGTKEGQGDDGKFVPLPGKDTVVLMQKKVVKVKYKKWEKTTHIDLVKKRLLQPQRDAYQLWKSKRNFTALELVNDQMEP